MPDEILASHGHLKDAYRRWLRYTYQEGPGFRFLATSGGRAADAQSAGPSPRAWSSTPSAAS